MLDFLQWRIMKSDTAPGSLVYAGPDKSFTPSVSLCSFGPDGIEERPIDGDPPDTGDGRTHLVQLVGVHDADRVGRIGAWLDIHPLILEDIMNTGQRPKLDTDEDALFMVLKDVETDPGTGRAKLRQLGIYWSGSTVLTFQEHAAQPWAGVLARIRSGKGRIRKAGAAYLAVALADAVVKQYYAVLDDLNNRAEQVEEDLCERLTEDGIMALYGLKREVVLLRSVFIPARDMLDDLARQEASPIPEETMPYLADARDHAQQVVEAATTLHDILSDMLSVQMSLAGMHMNNVMKVLTVIATIFIPLTFLAGIYGMNFDTMPELHWPFGYPLLLGVMVLIAVGMIAVFKRRDWF